MLNLFLNQVNSFNNESKTSIRSIAAISKKDCEILNKHKDFLLFKKYLNFLKFQKRYSLQTLRAYAHALAELAIISDTNSVSKIQSETIRLAIGQARTKGMKASAIAHRISVWRSYVRWLSRNSEISTNPLDGIKTKNLAKKLPSTLTVDQMQQLLEKPTGKKINNSNVNKIVSCRNQAILELFYSSGLRLNELISLNTHYIKELAGKDFGWLDMNESKMNIHGKGNKRRIVPIGKKAVQALNEWLIVRPRMLNAKFQHEPALFISTRSQRISPSSVRSIVQLAGKEANLPVHLHPHMLRHSFASHLLQSSNNIRAVQKLLGHKSIASTQIYTSLDFQYLSQAYDAAHPRAINKMAQKK